MGKMSFAALGGYTGPVDVSDVFPFEGHVAFDVVGGTKGKGKDAPHHPYITWDLRAKDEDCAGMKLKRTTMTGDNRPPEAQRGGNLARQTADVLFSSGVLSIDDVHARAQAGGDGDLDEDEIIAAVVGRTVYGFVKASLTDQGRDSSEIDRFESAEDYAKAKAQPGAYRRERPKLTPAAAKSQGALAPILSLGGPGGQKPSALGPVPSALGTSPALGALPPPAAPAAALPGPLGALGGLRPLK